MRTDKLPRIGETVFFRDSHLDSVATLTWMRLGGRAGLGWQLATPNLVIEDVPEDLARALARFLTECNGLRFDSTQSEADKVQWVSNCTEQFWVSVRTILRKAGYL